MNLTVSAYIQDSFTREFFVTDSNRLILQREEIIPNNLLPNTLAVNASGSGCAFLQVTNLSNRKFFPPLVQ